MRTLVIDSATQACSVALCERGECLAGDWRLLGRGHAELLVPMIAGLTGLERVERVAVALGPGSFTGVRVGLAAARALAFAWGAALTGYATTALVAAMARGAHGAVPVGVALTAGHGEWFVQTFAADGTPLDDVRSAPPEAAAAVLKDVVVVAGTEAAAAVALRGFGTPLDLLPDARAFALLPPAALTGRVGPIYGRVPDARPSGVASAPGVR